MWSQWALDISNCGLALALFFSYCNFYMEIMHFYGTATLCMIKQMLKFLYFGSGGVGAAFVILNCRFHFLVLFLPPLKGTNLRSVSTQFPFFFLHRTVNGV